MASTILQARAYLYLFMDAMQVKQNSIRYERVTGGFGGLVWVGNVGYKTMMINEILKYVLFYQ